MPSCASALAQPALHGVILCQNHGMPAAPVPLWAALRDTHGVALPSRDPIAVALSTYPALRGLRVPDLAERLSVSELHAQRGIAAFVADTFGPDALMRPGESFDHAVMRQGRPAPWRYLPVGLGRFRG